MSETTFQIVVLKYKPSASLNMMRGLFPPSSSDTFFKFDLAPSAMMMRPTWIHKSHVQNFCRFEKVGFDKGVDHQQNE
jgi:hypothetical protein